MKHESPAHPAPTQSRDYDLVIVGGGSGGYAAARTARELGASVAIVDRGPLGGLCILRGCMPSKTLIATSDALHDIREANELGVHAGEPRANFAEVMARKRRIIKGFADYRVEGLETFDIFPGRAHFRNDRELEVGDMLLRAKHFIVATGSTIAPPVFPGLADAGFFDSDEALELEAPPKSLIVLGGGYVGCELGQFFYRLGIPTTFLIRSKQLLSGQDEDVGLALTRYFREEGMHVVTGARVERVERAGELKRVVYRLGDREETVEAHDIFYALGRIPNIEGLGLEAAGVNVHPVTGIEVDASLRTSSPRIFAVGDVTGRFPLVHVAIQQGEIAARNAVRDAREQIDYSISKAHTVFTDPQVGVVGDTERELSLAGIAYLKATYPFDDHGKSIAIGKTKGFVKMLCAPRDGKILGVQILGPHASDLIHTGIVAMHFGATVFDFMKIPHLHPTLAEILTYPAEELATQVHLGRALAVAK